MLIIKSNSCLWFNLYVLFSSNRQTSPRDEQVIAFYNIFFISTFCIKLQGKDERMVVSFGLLLGSDTDLQLTTHFSSTSVVLETCHKQHLSIAVWLWENNSNVRELIDLCHTSLIANPDFWHYTWMCRAEDERRTSSVSVFVHKHAVSEHKLPCRVW